MSERQHASTDSDPPESDSSDNGVLRDPHRSHVLAGAIMELKEEISKHAAASRERHEKQEIRLARLEKNARFIKRAVIALGSAVPVLVELFRAYLTTNP